jgi:hypothetical protein
MIGKASGTFNVLRQFVGLPGVAVFAGNVSLDSAALFSDGFGPAIGEAAMLAWWRGCRIVCGGGNPLAAKEIVMGSAFIVSYQTKPDAAEENARLVERVFAELGARDPGGLRYATFRLEDGVSFMHVVIQESDDNPLPRMEAFEEFQRGVGDRCVAPPTRVAISVVGAYRLLTG